MDIKSVEIFCDLFGLHWSFFPTPKVGTLPGLLGTNVECVKTQENTTDCETWWSLLKKITRRNYEGQRARLEKLRKI